MRLIFEDAELSVLVSENSGPLTLITFAPIDFNPDPKQPWGQGLGDALGLRVVGFVAKRRNWYPKASITRAAEAVRPFLTGLCISYGYSMGAYGALKYSRLLPVRYVIAFSPQYSIDPWEVGFDQRYLPYFEKELHAGMGIKSCDVDPAAHYWIFSDPRDAIEVSNAIMFPGGPLVHHIRTAYMEHRSLHSIMGASTFLCLLIYIIGNDTQNVSRLIRDQKKTTGVYIGQLAVSARRRNHLSWWLSLKQRLIADPMLKREGLEHTAYACLGSGWLDDAEELYRRLFQRGEHTPSAHLGFSQTLQLLGKRKDARVAASGVAKQFPLDAHVQARAGFLSDAAGDSLGAIRYLARALRLDPNVSYFYKGLATILGAIGHPAEARLAAVAEFRLTRIEEARAKVSGSRAAVAGDRDVDPWMTVPFAELHRRIVESLLEEFESGGTTHASRPKDQLESEAQFSS